MAVYGFKENHCKEEVVSRTEVEKKYQVKKSYDTLTMSNGTMNVVSQDNHEYRVAYVPNTGVTNSNISITAPDMYATNQHFNCTVTIDTGEISPTVAMGLRVNIDDNVDGVINISGTGTLGRLICVGSKLPSFLSSNSVYTIKIWFDGFSMCYQWSSYKYA